MVNKLNTVLRYCKHWILQIYTDQNIFQWFRTRQILTAKKPYCSSFCAIMAPPTTISCLEHRACKIMRTASTDGLADELIFHVVASVHS